MFQECFGDDSGISLECLAGISGLFSQGFLNLSEMFLPKMFQEYSQTGPAMFSEVFRSGSYGCRATVAGFFKISARVRARDGYLRAPPWSKLDRIWMVFRDAGT